MFLIINIINVQKYIIWIQILNIDVITLALTNTNICIDVINIWIGTATANDCCRSLVPCEWSDCVMSISKTSKWSTCCWTWVWFLADSTAQLWRSSASYVFEVGLTLPDRSVKLTHIIDTELCVLRISNLTIGKVSRKVAKMHSDYNGNFPKFT